MNWLTNMIGLFIIAILLTGCISIPTGDGGSIKLSKDGVEIEDKEGEKSTITVDEDKGGYTIETDETVAKAGSDATIPEDFPKDILLPKDGTLLLSNETDQDGLRSYMLSYEMQGTMVNDAEMYHTYLTDYGYEVEEIKMAETMIAYQGRTDTHYLHYQMMGDAGDSTYTLQILYGEID